MQTRSPNRIGLAAALAGVSFALPACEEKYTPKPVTPNNSSVVESSPTNPSANPSSIRTSKILALDGNVTGAMDYHAMSVDVSLTFQTPGTFAIVAMEPSRSNIEQKGRWTFEIATAGEQRIIKGIPTVQYLQFIQITPSGELKIELGKFQQ